MSLKKLFCSGFGVVAVGGVFLFATLLGGRDLSQVLSRHDTFFLAPGTPGGIASDGTNFLVAQRGDNGRITAMLVSNGTYALLQTTDLGRTGGVPRVAFDGARYLMIWPDVGAPPADVFGQFISLAGTAIGSPFLIEPDAGVVEAGGLAFDGTNYLAVWEANGGDTNSVSTVHGRLISTTGNLLGPRIQLSEASTAQKYPAVASSRDDFLVIWTGKSETTNAWSVLGRGIGRDGTPAQSVAISEAPAQQPWPPAVASDGTNWLALWSRETGPFPVFAVFLSNMWMPMLFGRIVAADLTAPAPEFEIRRGGLGTFKPAAIFNGTNYLISWTEQHYGENLGPPTYTYSAAYWNHVGQLDSKGQPVTTELRNFYNYGYTNPTGLTLGYAAGSAISVWRLESAPVTFGQSFVRVVQEESVLSNFKLLPTGESQFDITGENVAWRFGAQSSTNLTNWDFVPYTSEFSVANQGTFAIPPPPGGSGSQRFFRTIHSRSVCVENLRLIARAKAHWALENKKTNTDYPGSWDLFGGGYLREQPVCPRGGVYELQQVQNHPTCSFGTPSGHTY
ncbi:MAG TPA: hypothetical protein VFT34_04175 [Verrucomicrobiae bacterium]|nr:hypothetical protein [Verrucomicrobiae bacterium]